MCFGCGKNHHGYLCVSGGLTSVAPAVNVVEETDLFLRSKDEWKVEIEEKLIELKSMETALSSRELELSKVGVV